jgi:hypothetical protein
VLHCARRTAATTGTIIASHLFAGSLPADEGFRIAFLVGAASAVVAAVAVLLIPGRARSQQGLSAGGRVTPASGSA